MGPNFVSNRLLNYSKGQQKSSDQADLTNRLLSPEEQEKANEGKERSAAQSPVSFSLEKETEELRSLFLSLSLRPNWIDPAQL